MGLTTKMIRLFRKNKTIMTILGTAIVMFFVHFELEELNIIRRSHQGDSKSSEKYIKFFKLFQNAVFINPQAPVAQKIADEVVFRRFQGEGVVFFKSDLTCPLQIFDAHLLENTNLTLTRPIGIPPHAPVAQKIADQR